MFTIFAAPKPFTNPHIATIQTNAITSWSRLNPRPEIILFGDEPGVAEIAQKLHVTHQPNVQRNQHGTPILSDIFFQAQAKSKYPIVCYCNSDIILMDDFVAALRAVSQQLSRFLMVAQRHDTDVNTLMDFEEHWQEKLRDYAHLHGKRRGPTGIDFFAFPRGQLRHMPEFAVGRAGWDTWMVFDAVNKRIPVVDVSESVLLVHQNHDYSHHSDGLVGTRHGDEAKRNIYLGGGESKLYTLDDVSHRLKAGQIERVWSWKNELKLIGTRYPRLRGVTRFATIIIMALSRRLSRISH